MEPSIEESRRIAMLVDGDNAQPSLIEDILAEIAKYGIVTTRRIYGDWTVPQMKGWKDSLHTSAIQPIQQFRYTVGKNATDSALIIDAMDLLHGETVDGFCIVSSDSDYTRLATRIREQGLFVMGIGQYQTPESFVKACEIFVHTENLNRPEEGEPTAPEIDKSGWIRTVEKAVEMATQEDGWAALGVVGTNIRKLDPAFDSRSYGYRQLSLLIKSRPRRFETRASKAASGHFYVKLK